MPSEKTFSVFIAIKMGLILHDFITLEDTGALYSDVGIRNNLPFFGYHLNRFYLKTAIISNELYVSNLSLLVMYYNFTCRF